MVVVQGMRQVEMWVIVTMIVPMFTIGLHHATLHTALPSH